MKEAIHAWNQSKTILIPGWGIWTRRTVS
jgi:hypothetical protein